MPDSSTRYAGKRVVVIGGTSGMGLDTARLLAEEGARVLVTGHDAQSLDAARAALGPGATVVANDITDLTQLASLASAVETELGGVDLLFANAGITRIVALDQVDEAMFDEVFGINTKGVYFTVQRLAPLLAEGGAVVVTTSYSDVKGQPGTTVYAASKAAARSMVRTLARELQPRGIRVNAVRPGPIDTGILNRSMPPDAAEQLTAQLAQGNPMGRLGRCDEIARAVAFLAFEATFTTGAELPVDGGATTL